MYVNMYEETRGRLGFDSRQRQGLLSLCHRVQTGSESHLASYPLGTGGKSGQGVTVTTHIHLVPRLRMRGTTCSLLNTSSWRGA